MDALLANLSRRRYAMIAMPMQMNKAGTTMTTMPLSMAWTDPGIMVIVTGSLDQIVGLGSVTGASIADGAHPTRTDSS
jgi:predicted benzoate:H+ symporter BenE